MSEEHVQEQWKKQLVKCIRCGTCRSVCPVFKEENSENTTARGKVQLLEGVVEGNVKLTPILQERFNKCLLCKACVKGCPSGVRTDLLFLSARQANARKNSLPLVKRVAFKGLTFRKLFDTGLRFGSVMQNVFMKKSADGRGNQARFNIPGSGLDLRRIIPPLADKPLRDRIPEKITGENAKGKAVFFTGCMLNYIYPEAGEAVVNILRKNGWDVTVPSDQACCGTPAFTSGDQDTGRKLAADNVQVLSGDYDVVITACASCGAALKNEYGEIIQDEDTRRKWEKISAKVMDISEFVEKFGDPGLFGPLPLKITYHDACHLVRGMDVSKQPRQVFAAVPKLDFRDMKDADVCCGAGGTFSMVYYDLSRRINDHKLDNAADTGADYLVTGCSACRMHITDGLSQRGSNMKVMHTAELIDMAYKSGENQKKGGK
ncbi:MAG: (Fe-S)-binding protein [Veillonellales bacterium]